MELCLASSSVLTPPSLRASGISPKKLVNTAGQGQPTIACHAIDSPRI
jgi:hypothetical protein